MNRKSIAYSGILLLALILTSVVLNKDVVRGLTTNSEVTLSTTESTHLLGQDVVFNGSLVFVNDESATIDELILRNASGPQAFSVALPIFDTGGSYVDLSSSVSGSLRVKITFNDVVEENPGSGTLPGGTLPGSGDFKGGSAGGTIVIEAIWTPPVFLDPAPVFNLIPVTDSGFSIPLIPTPVAASGTKLPSTDLQFAIPTVGQPSGTVLPNLTSTRDIPQVTIATNASATTPSLPNTTFTNGGFNIPTVAVEAAPSGVNSFPDTTFAYNIPSPPVVTAPTGVPDVPEFAADFTVSGTPQLRGLGPDSGTGFWAISDGTGAGGTDEIVNLDSSGNVTSTLATPMKELEGVAYLNGSLWVLENEQHCGDLINAFCNFINHWIFKFDPSSPPAATLAAWSGLTNFSTADDFDEMGGITAEGSGSTGTLWIANRFGYRFYNLSQTGSEQSAPFTDSFVGDFDALALSGAFLYTANASKIVQWSKTGSKVQEFQAVKESNGNQIPGLRGMTFKLVSSKDVLFLAGSEGIVYKGFFAESVTNDPVGIAFSPSTAAVGEALWVVVNGAVNDKILKVNTSTGALITSFSGDGSHNAPSNKIEGVTFLAGSLWMVSNEFDPFFFNDTRKLYKVNAQNGSVQNTFDLGTTASIFDNLGAITNNGTNLIVHNKTNFSHTWVIDTSGQLVEDNDPCCPSSSFEGARGLAFHTGRQQFFAANGGLVAIYNNSRKFVQEQGLQQSSGTPPTGVQGMTFDGNLLYIAHTDSGKISKSFLATTVDTTPRGVAYTSGTTTAFGTALWILVDGNPKAKLIKVDPADGSLITSFGTAGAVDMPTTQMEGITFLSDFLWAVGSEGSGFDSQPKLYKINPTTGAVAQTFSINSQFIHGDLGGITNDGANLIVYSKNDNSMTTLDTSGQEVDGSFLDCCPNTFGAKGFARHSGRNQYFAAKGSSLLTIDSNLQTLLSETTLQTDSSGFQGTVEGLAFNQDIAYVAHKQGSTGKISLGAVRDTVTVTPEGVAFSPSGSNLSGSSIGKALWVLVDGDPADMILKIDPDTGLLVSGTNFPSASNDVGFVAAPSKTTEGVTYLGGHLYIVSNESDQNFGQSVKVYKVKATDGSLVSTFNLSNNINLFDDIGAITNDGTDLLLFNEDFDRLSIIDTSGQSVDDKDFCCQSPSGARGAARRIGTDQVLTAKGSDIVQYSLTSSGFDPLQQIASFSTALSGIQGLVLDNGSTDSTTDTDPSNDTLYAVHTGSGLISSTGIPSDKTNNPRGLAYDSSAGELYILVDGKGKAPDHVVVTNTSGTQQRDFAMPRGDAHGITLLGGSLYVSLEGSSDFGPGQREIVVLNPSTGAETDRFDIGFVNGQEHAGLSNNGTNLILAPEFGGLEILDPSDGSRVDDLFLFDPTDFNAFFEQFGALAFNTTSEEFFPVDGNDVFRFDDEGRLVEDFTLNAAGFNSVQGAVFVGATLFLADSSTDTVRSGLVPTPPTAHTSDPVAMATDGTSLWVAVNATPVDLIMKLDPTNTSTPLVTTFGNSGSVGAPGKEVGGIALHNGSLYVVTNDIVTFEQCNQFGCFPVQQSLPIIHELDPDTGADLENPVPINVSDQFGGFTLTDPVGALASDGNNLYAGVQGDGIEGAWFAIDPGSGFGQQINEFEGQLPRMSGFEAFEITTGPQFPANRQLIAAGDVGNNSSDEADTIARFNRQDGAMFGENTNSGQFVLTGKDIKGLAYQTSTKTLFLADDATNKIFDTKLPENTGIELTTVGNYSAELAADIGASTLVSPITADYSIVRNNNLQMVLDSPVNDFILTTPSTVIAGRINDPSVNEVEVGITLPFTKFLDDPVDPSSGDLWSIGTDGGSALWHIACSDGNPNGNPNNRFSSASCAWRYSIPGGASFDTGSPTRGSLVTADPVPVSGDTRLRFTAGFSPEFQADVDLKLVQIATIDTDLQGNDVLGPWQTIIQVVGPGGSQGFPPPGDAGPGFKFIELQPLFANPNLAQIDESLGQFAGDRVKIRFRFDSVDEFANGGEGWYVDDIEVSGSGIKSITIPTTPIDVTDQVNGTSTRLFRSFSTTFALSEGFNTVSASAQQPYSPFASQLLLAQGFVDTTAPVVTLAGLPAATNNLIGTLTGTIKDDTLQLLQVTQTVGTSTQTILSKSSIGDGTFSVGVSLVEGTNTFTAIATDGGNLTSTAVLPTVGDITPPTAQVKIVTITSQGEALLGDDFFVAVAAEDALSGIDQVFDGQGNDLAPVSDVPSILVAMNDLGNVNPPTTHIQLGKVQPGTPVGANSLAFKIRDKAGNEATTNAILNVVSARTNRNFFLFPGNNFMGLALIPDDDDPNTTDDASLDRLMGQDVTGQVNPAFVTQQNTTTITLGAVVESTFAFNKAGNFIVHTPGDGAADTLTNLSPFQGMIIKTKETSAPGTTTPVDVFKKVNVAGFTAQQAVPIRINIQGVFSPRGAALPPSKEMRVGFNLIAPHILADTLFDTVFRGALIPRELAVSALSFERRVDARADASDIRAEIFEGFVSNSIGGLLKPVLSYWTFIVDDPQNDLVNEFGDQLGPTITP